VVAADGPAASRLIAKLVTAPAGGVISALLRPILPVGDLVMMRRQLLNLKARTEATATDAADA
jgi:hypothetical protein